MLVDSIRNIYFWYTTSVSIGARLAKLDFIATIVYNCQNSPLICTGVVDLDEVWRHSFKDALFPS